MFNDWAEFQLAAAERLLPQVKFAELSLAEIQAMLLKPPQPEMGEIAFPCFTLAKKLRQSPPAIAQKIAAELAVANRPIASPFSQINAVGGYVNFTINIASLAETFFSTVHANELGSNNSGRKQTVVIDYSSPNIAKPLAVHHIRSTMIGAALARLYKVCGWEVITINHLGDWGTNFGQLLVAYQNAKARGENPATDLDAQLKLYIEFHQAAEKNPQLEAEARAGFKKLESGDAETVKMWEIFRAESIKGLKKLYTRLKVEFTHYTGESFFNDKMAATVERLRAKNLLTTSDGAEVVDLRDEKIELPCLIEKSDGATTYATRDLAAAEYRAHEYHFDKCLYVVANQQELHFRQIFAVLKKMGYAWARSCEHIKFGMLSFAAGVFGDERATGSTRKGQIIFLDEVLNAAVEKARTLITENARDETLEVDKLAEQVGVGAVIFSEFMQRRMKDVVFSWEKALNMHGDSGPYLQYTHARLSSLIEKSTQEIGKPAIDVKYCTELERGVILKVLQFSPTLVQAMIENEPSIIAEYLLELCTTFNQLYANKREYQIVDQAQPELSWLRIGLVDGVRQTLRRGLFILGLHAPEKM